MMNRFVPERVKSFSAAKDWKVIAGGQHHTLAIDKDGMRLLCPLSHNFVPFFLEE